jgi:hypothetical protein
MDLLDFFKFRCSKGLHQWKPGDAKCVYVKYKWSITMRPAVICLTQFVNATALIGTDPVYIFLLSHVLISGVFLFYLMLFVMQHWYWQLHCWVWSSQERPFTVLVHVTLKLHVYCYIYVGNWFIIAIRHHLGFVIYGQITTSKGCIQVLHFASCIRTALRRGILANIPHLLGPYCLNVIAVITFIY